MNPFQQFIDLHETNPDFFEGKADIFEDFLKAVADDDDRNLRRFANDLAEMMKPDYGVNLNGVKSPRQPALVRRDIPDYSSAIITCVNDTYYVPASLFDGKVKVAVYDADTFPFGLNAYHSLSHFNRVFSQKVLHISVEGGAKLEHPLQINNILSAAVDLAAFRRIFIEVGGGAEAKIIFNDTSADADHRYLSSQFVDVFLNDDAHLELYDITDTSDNVARLNELKVKLKRRCDFNLYSLSLSAGNAINIYDLDFESDNSEARINGFVIGDGNQRIGNSTFVNHLSRHCRSNQNFKYVLDEKSHGTFYGEIFVWEVARFTEAYQSNKNILVSRDARMLSEPQLLIYNDDVKCSHGASTGQLDESALFYMRQRGIPENVARTMLTQAFVGDVVDAVKYQPLRDRLRLLVENRLYKRSSRPCDNCRMGCDTLNRK